jgi:DNA-binding PadR family transcriptional regulator
VQKLNATQGTLLGFLMDEPKSGWELLNEISQGLSRFWNVTTSHIYRELKTLDERKLIHAGEPGPRDRTRYGITREGRRAFKEWLADAPGDEQIRFPFLLTLWFGRHLEPAQLEDFRTARRSAHTQRLAMYRQYEKSIADDPYLAAVVSFGIGYEEAIVRWLDHLSFDQDARPVTERSVERT